jgi:hypothetical protein
MTTYKKLLLTVQTEAQSVNLFRNEVTLHQQRLRENSHERVKYSVYKNQRCDGDAICVVVERNGANSEEADAIPSHITDVPTYILSLIPYPSHYPLSHINYPLFHTPYPDPLSLYPIRFYGANSADL